MPGLVSVEYRRPASFASTARAAVEGSAWRLSVDDLASIGVQHLPSHVRGVVARQENVTPSNFALPRYAVTDVVLIITLPFLRCGSATLVRKKKEKMFVRNVRSSCRALIFSSDFCGCCSAALLTRICRPPNSFTTRETAR